MFLEAHSILLHISVVKDFPGGPVVKTLPSNAGGLCSIPDWENKVLHAAGKWKCQLLSCVRLCDHMDCSLPGSSVHGILWARILEWVAIPFSKGSSQPRGQTRVYCITGRFFTVFEPPGKRWWPYHMAWPRKRIVGFCICSQKCWLHDIILYERLEHPPILVSAEGPEPIPWGCRGTSVYYCINVFVCSPVDGHLGCFMFCE